MNGNEGTMTRITPAQEKALRSLPVELGADRAPRRSTLRRLVRLGLAREVGDFPSIIEPTKAGRDLRARALTDAERIALAESDSKTRIQFGVEQTRYLGPVEFDPCPTHPDQYNAFRWTWWIDASTPHEEAIEGSDAIMIGGCQKCEEE